ncbi:MAG: ABC transporter substrate-binding protein, partial [Acidimicrobiales bacterium]
PAAAAPPSATGSSADAPFGPGEAVATTAVPPGPGRPPDPSSVPNLVPGVASSPAGPLRLGLVVPTRGAQAAEGAAVERIVRQRVVVANTAGGVAGFPVELLVVPAEDVAAVRALAGRVDALVGGFGADPPPDTPWLLPADPSIAGSSVVSAETTPRSAGAHLAQALRRKGLRGPIGVVVGSGADAALAAGLASGAATTTVGARPGTSCAPEISDLAAAGAAALAVAGDADLALRCLRALARSSWRPPYGTVLAPSAAYAGIEKLPEALGVRTVLALPWPTSLLPGAARFRASSETTSYRALISYAATELAIDVARQSGDLSVASVAAGTWRSDLLDLVGLSSRMPIVVTAILGTWLPVL